MSKPTFYKVATRPKWIGGLLLALAVAAIFASLAQWQADRTFRFVPKAETNQTLVPLEKLATSGSAFLAKQADRLVSVEAKPISGECYVVANRVQLEAAGGGKTGFWVVRPAFTADDKFITLALGWFATEEESVSECRSSSSGGSNTMQTFRGIYEPSEEATISNGIRFESLSVEQLINQPGLPETIDAYPGFVIVQKPENLGEPILIGKNPGQTVFNWLTAFYAAEWILFAGFAFFLWGRLVQDEVNRQKREGRID